MYKTEENMEIVDEAEENDSMFESGSEEEAASDLSGYKIRSYPSDFTLRGIYDKWNAGEIYIPTFQRAYVWQLKQASKLIDSFLLGLPVPPVFLYEDDRDNSSIVIDGQQRIKSIVAFFKGEFPKDPNEKSGLDSDNGDNDKRPREFRLKLEGKYNGLTYSELDKPDKLKLDNSVLRAVNVFQQTPENQNSCMFHIFERLNTGGTKLNPQEIRNCVWHGNFNSILKELNTYENWRNILGNPEPHKRMRDVELILLIFALHGGGRKDYRPPLKEFLNNAMDKNIGSNAEVEAFATSFKNCADLINEKFRERPCHFNGRVNEQVLEALFCAIIDNENSVPGDIGDRFDSYRTEYRNEVIASKATADTESVNKRYDFLLDKLFS